jgi:hypothetical protein
MLVPHLSSRNSQNVYYGIRHVKIVSSCDQTLGDKRNISYVLTHDNCILYHEHMPLMKIMLRFHPRDLLLRECLVVQS